MYVITNIHQQLVLPCCFFPLRAWNVLILPLEGMEQEDSEFHAQEIHDRFLAKKENIFLRLYTSKHTMRSSCVYYFGIFLMKNRESLLSVPQMRENYSGQWWGMSSLLILLIFKNRDTDALMIMKVIFMELEHGWTLLVWVLLFHSQWRVSSFTPTCDKFQGL